MTKLPKQYHDLKQYAIGFFALRAGYIPKVGDDKDFSDPEIICKRKLSVLYAKRHCTFHWMSVDDGGAFGQVHGVWLSCTACWECHHHLKNWFGDHPTIHLETKFNKDIVCEYCGKIGGEHDDIPF